MSTPEHHLIVVPHTHWDREWYRTHEQFRWRLVRLIDDLLDLLESDTDFRHFTLDGQAIVVDDYLEVRPGARDRLAKLIESGRLLVGPWYVLPDEWLVSGEALVRNLRTGLGRAESHGAAMRLGYVPDQFGHVGQLPQIFRGFGFDAAVLWRGVGEDVRETLFDWQAPDGTTLLTVYLANGYGNAAELPSRPERLALRLRDEVERLGRRSRIPTLLMMNGSDHLRPDPQLPSALRAAAAELPGVSAEIGTLPAFVERARVESPGGRALHRGELRSGLRAPLLPGCASARMPQKRADFENDRLLLRYLEPLSTWLDAVGGRADRELLDFLWRLVLENHPHDSICGCSVDAVHDQMDTRFARVRELGEEELARVFGALASRLVAEGATERAGPQLVVWNPGSGGPTPVEAVVEVDAAFASADGATRIVDAAGRARPCACEPVEPARTVLSLRMPVAFGGAFAERAFGEFLGFHVQELTTEREGDVLRVRLCLGRQERCDADLERQRDALVRALEDPAVESVDFAAVTRARWRVRFVESLPAMGLRRFHLVRGGERASMHEGSGAVSGARRSDGGIVLENEFWRIDAEPDGRVHMRSRRTDVVVEDALRLVSEGDRGDEYNFDPVVGDVPVDRPEAVELELEVGEGVFAEAVLRAGYAVPQALAADRSRRSESTVVLPAEIRVRLWAGVDRVDIRSELDNTARDHRLRLVVGAPCAAECFEVESAFEIAERPIEPQGPAPGERIPAERPVGATPQRTFASIGDARWTLSIANRGLAEAEARVEGERAALAVTVLRAVGWLSRGDLGLRPMLAGPPFETPGAQVPGPHTAEISLRWHETGAADRITEAHRFAYPPIAIQAATSGGVELAPIGDGDRLLEIDDPEVRVSAVEPDPDGTGLVRVWNPSDRPRRVRLRWLAGGSRCWQPVDLLGRSAEGLRDDPDGAELELRPWELVALRLTPH